MRYRSNFHILFSHGFCFCCCLIGLIIYFGHIPITWSADNYDKDSINHNNVFFDKDEAFNRAIAYLGFDGLPGFSEKNRGRAQLGNITDCRTPFVADYMKTNEVWKLNFRDVPLSLNSGEVRRDFEVIIDGGSGKLLSVYSLSNDYGSSDTLPEPSAYISQKELSDRLILFDDLPSKQPKKTLIEAFTVCHKRPCRAKVIRAMCIDFHTRKTVYNNAWIIILRGTESPMEQFGKWGRVPVNERNTLLYCVDSETGLLIFCMDGPQDTDLIRRMKGIITEDEIEDK